MSDEIKNFREAVLRIDELQADLEVLVDRLDSSFENYKNISDNSSEMVAKLNQILQSVNTLQINLQNTIEGVESQSAKILKSAEIKAEAATKAANDLKTQMGEYWSQEYSQTKEDFDALIKEINDGIDDLKRDIAIKIRDAADGLELDTTELQKAIREQVGKIDIEPIKDAIDRANDANAKLDKGVKNIETFSKNIGTSIKKRNDELKEYYAEQGEWIKKLKKQNSEIQKAWKTPKKFLLMMISAMLIGLSLGVISAKYITDKPLVVYKDLNIRELAKKSGEKDWINVEVLAAEMKNKDTECNLLSFIPWWVILMFGIILMIILSPNEEKEDNYRY